MAAFVEIEPAILQTAVPVAIAVVGWVTTHILSLRAQREGFRNQVLDRARTDVTVKLRHYQEWLSKLSTWIRTLNLALRPVIPGVIPKPREKAEELLSLQQRGTAARAWSVAVEDYQILFPEAALARFRLDRRHLRIIRALGGIQSDLLKLAWGNPSAGDLDAVVASAEANLDLINDQVALIEDLRIHLQNVALSKVMDRNIQSRHPPDENVPRLMLTEAGSLEVVDANGKPLDDQGETPDQMAVKILAPKR